MDSKLAKNKFLLNGLFVVLFLCKTFQQLQYLN